MESLDGSEGCALLEEEKDEAVFSAGGTKRYALKEEETDAAAPLKEKQDVRRRQKNGKEKEMSYFKFNGEMEELLSRVLIL